MPKLPGLLLAAWTLAAGAQQAEPDLEELLRQAGEQRHADAAVSTSGRKGQSQSLAPGVTHVVTRQDIERLGLRNFGEVLQLFPGLYLRQDQLFTTVGVRGIGRAGDLNSRLLFLLDGMRLNENIYDAGQIDEDFLLDVGMIERVEYSAGPGSSLYGANAFLGVVNVITQRADQLAGWQGQAVLEPRGRWQTRISHARRDESGGEWWIAASGMERRDLPLTFAVQAGDEAPLRRVNDDRARRLNLGWRRAGLAVSGGLVERERRLPAALDRVEDDLITTAAPDWTRIRHLRLSWERPLGEGWELQAAWSAQQLDYRTDWPYLDEQGEALLERYGTLGRWGVAELRAAGPVGERHELQAGLEWQRDQTQQFFYEITGEDRWVERYRARRVGLFVQDEWALAERQRLVLGLRWDDASLGGRRWSPRLAYAWSPSPGRSLKLTVGSAYRGANRFESAQNEAFDRLPPPAERVSSTELAWESGETDRRWRVHLFSNRFSGLIDSAEEGYFVSSPRLRNRGVDLGLDLALAHTRLQLDATLQSSRYADGRRPSNSPRQLLKWRWMLPLAPQWALGLHGRLLSRRDAGQQALPGHGLLHAHLHWQPLPMLGLGLGVQNLTRRRYLDAPALDSHDPVLHRGSDWRLIATLKLP